jgi:hypothetical protein
MLSILGLADRSVTMLPVYRGLWLDVSCPLSDLNM